MVYILKACVRVCVCTHVCGVVKCVCVCVFTHGSVLLCMLQICGNICIHHGLMVSVVSPFFNSAVAEFRVCVLSTRLGVCIHTRVCGCIHTHMCTQCVHVEGCAHANACIGSRTHI